jgi:valyl-tRNA synthetase
VAKLWNINKYVHFSYSQFQALSKEHKRSFQEKDFQISSLWKPEEVKDFSLPERFIIHRFHEVLQNYHSLLLNYQFHESGKVIYEFLWDEFADWYIEFSKFSFRISSSSSSSTSPEELAKELKRAHRTMKTLFYIWNLSLRLLHPYMPFISEILYQSLPNQEKEKETIMMATWPMDLIGKQESKELEAKALEIDQQSVQEFETVKTFIKTMRNLRTDHQIPAQQKTPIILYSSPPFHALFQEHLQAICFLSKIDPKEITYYFTNHEEFEEPKQQNNNKNLKIPRISSEDLQQSLQQQFQSNLIHGIISEHIQIYLPPQQKTVLNVEKEIERLQRQHFKTEKELLNLQSRLGNEKFLAKANKELIAEVQTKVADLSGQLEKIQQSLESLQKQ